MLKTQNCTVNMTRLQQNDLHLLSSAGLFSDESIPGKAAATLRNSCEGKFLSILSTFML